MSFHYDSYQLFQFFMLIINIVEFINLCTLADEIYFSEIAANFQGSLHILTHKLYGQK